MDQMVTVKSNSKELGVYSNGVFRGSGSNISTDEWQYVAVTVKYTGKIQIAEVLSNTVANQAYWTQKSESLGNPTLNVNDTLLVTMGKVKDYFRPTEPMQLREFLTSYNSHTWSPTGIEGTFKDPPYSHQSFGGSEKDWSGLTDGRGHLSFWGNETLEGGCCHSSNNDRFGSVVDPHSWGHSFKMDLIGWNRPYLGTTTFYVGNSTTPPQIVGTADMVSQAVNVNWDLGGSTKGPGKLASAKYWSCYFTRGDIFKEWDETKNTYK